MKKTGAHAALLVQRFTVRPRPAARARALAVGHGGQAAVALGVVKAVAAQRACRQGELLRPQARQAALHTGLRRQQAPQAVCSAVEQGEAFAQRHQTTAFSPQGFACLHMGVQLRAQPLVGGQGRGVQLGVAAGQPQGVARGQLVTRHGREKHQLRAQLLQRAQVGRVNEVKGRIACHGNRAPGQQGRQRRGRGRRGKGGGPALPGAGV